MTNEEAQEAAAAIQDGIYFGLPMEVYREVSRLSASGLQRMMISPATFWRDSWLNPNPPVLTPEQVRNRERAKLMGSAYHCARLEPDEFLTRYVRELAQEDMPKGTLFTGKDMSAVLKEKGLPVSGSVGEQADRLLAAGFPPEQLWHVAQARWLEECGGRQPIPAIAWDEIVVDMERIRAVPEVAEHLTGGEAEVSVFWTCPDTGLPMKARLDYLKPRSWTDFKSYANPTGKHVEQAITDAFKFNRYHIQAATYHEAVEAIRRGEARVQGEATDDQRDLVDEVALAADELECWYVFQEKGGVPNLFARQVQLFEVPLSAIAQHPITDDPEKRAAVERGQRQRTMLHTKARVQIRRAKELFQAYSDTFPEGEPWRPVNPLGTIGDLSFHPAWLESAE